MSLEDWLKGWLLKCRLAGKRSSGFTLLEALVVVVLVGIVAAIAAPGWFGFIEQRRLGVAQDILYQEIRRTQNKAQQTHKTWQFSIREGSSGYVEWAMHPRGSAPITWQRLHSPAIALDRADTTLATDASLGRAFYVRFDYKGNLSSGLGTVTLNSENNARVKRCVVVSTLLGNLRRGEGHGVRNGNGRYCY